MKGKGFESKRPWDNPTY